MKNIAVLSLMLLLLFPSIAGAGAEAFVPREGKVILIDQKNQEGWAYEDGKLLLSFPILAGDDETPTGNGRYTVRKKIKNYFSNRYQVPMPYSLFFVFSGSCRKAVHEGEVPKRKVDRQKKWATHGCIHVEMRIMKILFDWAQERTTQVIIFGRTT